MIQQIHALNTSSKYGSHQNQANFGYKLSELTDVLTEENNTGKTDEEFKADKFQKIAEMVQKDNKAPSALKAFAVVGSLSAASFITASVVSGRIFNFLNSANPAINVLGRNIKKGLTTAQGILAEKAAQNTKGLKGKAAKLTNKTLTYVENLAKHGAEKEIKEILSKSKQEIAEIKTLIKSQAEKKGIKLSVKEVNAEYKKYLEREKDGALGANLLKKATKGIFGTTAGVGTLKEAATDENNDGIPDVIQKKDAHKKAKERVTAALIDCALDSCGV